jgi:hypothetical protein
MGGPHWAARQALTALEEGIEVIRAMWRPEQTVGPRALKLTGRLADRWAAPIPSYLAYEDRPVAQAAIDAGARSADRDPAEVLRIAQLVGTITTARTPQLTTQSGLSGEAPIQADAGQWAELIASLVENVGFGAFIFWPEQNDHTQLQRWARDVVSAARDHAAR